jgi:hypothetical protein
MHNAAAAVASGTAQGSIDIVFPGRPGDDCRENLGRKT